MEEDFPKEILAALKWKKVAHLGLISGKLMSLKIFITGDTVGGVETQGNMS